MKQQIIVIHGGTSAFSTYEDFLKYLTTKSIVIEKFKGYRDWKGKLPETLGGEFDIIYPGMPNKENARYAEWKIWFERFIPFMKDNLILIGHSLGGIFLAKYLSEESIPKKIKAVFLVAAPYELRGKGAGQRKLSEFILPTTLEKFTQQGGKIFLYHSKDDPIVPFSELAKYQTALPGAHTTVLEDRGHFNQEQFPEIVEAITNL